MGYIEFKDAKTLLGFPSEFVGDDVKSTEEFGLEYFRAMWSQCNFEGVFNERRARFFTLRRWGAGLQRVDDLRQQMANGGDTSFLNIDLKPISVIPKFLDSMVGLLLNQQFKIQCNAIDKISVSKKDAEKSKMEADIMFKKFSEKLKEKVGVAMMDEEHAGKVLKTREEIDLFMDLNFKLAEEVSIELGIEYVFYNNDFEEIKKHLLYDLFTLCIAATYSYYDRNKKICIERVKPEWMVTSFTDRDDFKNITYGGFIKMMRIQDIRKDAGNKFTNEEYLKIAQSGSSNYNNPSWDTRYSYYPGSWNYNQWNNFLIPVLFGEFVSSTYNKYETFVNKKGIKRVKPAIKTNDEIDQYGFDIANKYEGRWILDTNFIYNYGKSANMPRERINNTYSLDVPLGLTVYAPNIYDMENKSHVERMIHSAQQMALSEAKLQQMQAQARPKGYVINIAGMQAVDLGLGGTVPPLQLQSIFNQTGVLYTNLVNEDGTPAAVPVLPMDSGLDLPGIQAQIAIYNLHLKMIQDLTGMNDAVDASSPSGEALVGVQKIATQATANNMRAMKSAYLNIIERTAKYVTLMIQDVCRYGNGIEGFIPAIGERAAQIIKLGADMALPDFGIKTEALPTDEEKADIMADINFGVQNGLIKPSDAAFCRTITNLKQMRLYLANREEVYRQQKMEEAQANAQASAQANAQAGQAVEQAKSQTVMVESQQKAELLTIEHEMNEAKADKDFQRKLKEMAIQHQYTMEEISLNVANKINQTSDMLK